MYDRAPSQSESDGLKPYVAPSHRMSKAFPVEAFKVWIGASEGDDKSRLVRFGAVDRFMV